METTDKLHETQPLIADEKSLSKVETDSHREQELFGLNDQSSRSSQLLVLIRQSLPVVTSYFLSVSGNFIIMVFAGGYESSSGDKSVVFAGISLANMFANVSCLSIIIGMSGAVETLASQHNGAGNYKEVGIVLQRSILILGLLTLPLVLLWFYVYELFTYVGIDPKVCVIIQRYLRIRTLCIPVDVFNACYEQYLMSIGVVQPSMWAYIFFNVSILSLCSLFVMVWEYPYECLGWVWVISMYGCGILQVLLSLPYHEVQRTLQPFNVLAFTEWWEFMQLGLPSAVMTCSEWWAFEILTLLASILSTKAAAVQSILMQTISLTFMIPLGIGIACTSLVGNAIGAEYLILAKRIGFVSIELVLVVQGVVAILLWYGGENIIHIFSRDEEVIAMARQAMPFISVFIILDGLQCIISSILRGTGNQFLGAVINVMAYYGVGLPLAYVLCFHWHFGLNGLLLGITTGGSLLQCVVLVACIYGFEQFMFAAVIHPTHPTATHTRSANEDTKRLTTYQTLSSTEA